MRCFAARRPSKLVGEVKIGAVIFKNLIFLKLFLCFLGREKGAVVPPEQATYLHYLSSHQRKLQILLEGEVRANQLRQFVTEADRCCYVDMVRKSPNFITFLFRTKF